jgi:hypothetical protein
LSERAIEKRGRHRGDARHVDDLAFAAAGLDQADGGVRCLQCGNARVRGLVSLAGSNLDSGPSVVLVWSGRRIIGRLRRWHLVEEREIVVHRDASRPDGVQPARRAR